MPVDELRPLWLLLDEGCDNCPLLLGVVLYCEELLWLDRSMPVLDAPLDPMPGAEPDAPLLALGLLIPLEDCPDFPGWLLLVEP